MLRAQRFGAAPANHVPTGDCHNIVTTVPGAIDQGPARRLSTRTITRDDAGAHPRKGDADA
jgi:hypothetical protein